MFVTTVGPKGKKSVVLMESYRPVKGGNSVHRIVKTFGPLKDLEANDPDALEKLKAQYRAQSAAKKEATAQMRREAIESVLKVDGSESSGVAPVLSYAHYPLVQIWNEDLALDRKLKFENAKLNTKVDLCAIVRYLATLKVIHPQSIQSSFQSKDIFIGDPVKAAHLQDFYDALDFIWKNKNGVMKFINKQMDQKFGKDRATLVFYDVTNTYFETPLTDQEMGLEESDYMDNFRAMAANMREDGRLSEECFDDDGEVIPEKLPTWFAEAVADEKFQFLRMRGPSKEHRTDLPIVSIALVVDGNGIPMDFEVFAGNDSEFDSVVKSVNALKAKYDIKGATLTADRGINSLKNLRMLEDSGLGFLVAQKVSQFNKELTDKMLDASLYHSIDPSDSEKGRYLEIKNWKKSGKTKKDGEVTCTLVLTYSEKRRKRDEAILNAWVDVVKKKQASGVKLKARRTGWASLAQTQDDTESPIIGINEKVLEQKRKLCGYAGLVYSLPKEVAEDTGEIKEPKGLSSDELASAYHRQVRIEECFRILKSELGLRPMYVWESDHIKGHITICMLALLLVRLLQYRLDGAGTHLSIREIIEALNDAQVAVLGSPANPTFLPIGRGARVRKGRETMSTKELCDAIKNKKIKTSNLPDIMTATGLQMPVAGNVHELARVLRTRFADGTSALPEVCQATLSC